MKNLVFVSIVFAIVVTGCATKEKMATQEIELATLEKNLTHNHIDFKKISQCPSFTVISEKPSTTSSQYIEEIKLTEDGTDILVSESNKLIPGSINRLEACKHSNGLIEIKQISRKLLKKEKVNIPMS